MEPTSTTSLNGGLRLNPAHQDGPLETFSEDKITQLKVVGIANKIVKSTLGATQIATAVVTAQSVVDLSVAANQFNQSLSKAQASEGVRSAVKIVNALQGSAGAVSAVASLGGETLQVAQILTTSSQFSLVGRVSNGFYSFSKQLQKIATALLMLATGYKVYENSRWHILTKNQLAEKIKIPSVESVSGLHDSLSLKKLVYDYFENKIAHVIKVGQERGVKAELQDRKLLETKISEQIDQILKDGDFIKDEETWKMCQEGKDKVEAFGLYIRVMLERLSHKQEIKRVFGKKGIQVIAEIRDNGVTDVLYNKAMSICRQRLLIDTLNFVLGIGILSLVAFSVSAALALPLVKKVSKSSPKTEHVKFAMKAIVLGSILLTPYGLLALALFSVGSFVYKLKSKRASSFAEESPTDTKYDKLLIKINIILAIFSIISLSYVGVTADSSLIATTALVSTQLPWLGLNINGLSQIWQKENEKKQKIKTALQENPTSKSMYDIMESYDFDLIDQVLSKTMEANKLKEILNSVELQSPESSQERKPLFETQNLPNSVSKILKDLKNQRDAKKQEALTEELKRHCGALSREGLILMR